MELMKKYHKEKGGFVWETGHEVKPVRRSKDFSNPPGTNYTKSPIRNKLAGRNIS